MSFSIKMTKAKLQEFGIPAENLDKAAEFFCAAHKTDLDAIIEERDDAKKKVKDMESVQKELTDLKAEVEKNGKDPYKVKYEAVRDELKQLKADIEAEKTQGAKSGAFRQMLKDIGIPEKRIDAIMRVSDIDAVQLGDDGKATNIADLATAAKSEWADFIPAYSEKGANPANPPKSNPSAPKKREDIYARDDKGRFKLDAAQRQAALAELRNSEKGS